jgi:uncharacterized protein YjiS (DUF1127 family)
MPISERERETIRKMERNHVGGGTAHATVFDRFYGWWDALPERRMTRRGLMELSSGQLRDIGVRHPNAFRTGQHFFRR